MFSPDWSTIMRQETRKTPFHCPHCGAKVRTRIEDRDRYACPRCSAQYLALVDEEGDRTAFFDESAQETSEPLWLPTGSIRAVVAGAMIYCCWHLAAQGKLIPPALLSLVLTVVGFYFGFRTKAAMLSDRVYDPAARREQPLFLPAGVVRLALVGGLAALGVWLATRGQVLDNPNYLEFFVVLGGLVLGWIFGQYVFPRKRTAGHAALNHLRGLAALAVAGGLTCLFVVGVYEQLSEKWLSVLCGTVSFYFGSRA